jgi:DNA-directed RNA polymerase specialized sigma24 family protein
MIAHDLDMMLSHLAPDERHLIDLVSQGLRHIDVARLMGWKDNTTFVKIKRLRDKIKGIWIEGYA